MRASVICSLLVASAFVVLIDGSNLPHIVMLLTDDLGWGSVPGYGGGPGVSALTPTLDSLRADGLTLTGMRVYQFCSPSRGAFLTGRYPYKLPQTRANFLPATIPDGTPLGYTMLPKKIAKSGYVSSHIGKVCGGRVRAPGRGR